MLYVTHSTGLLVGVTRERITSVWCLGVEGGESFPKSEETRWKNPFVAEMALCRTSGGNLSRVGVFWNGTAHGECAQWLGETLSAYMAGSRGQPQAVTVAGGRTKPW